MDALIPVFVAVLLAETGGRVQAVVHALGSKFPHSASTILAALALTSSVSLIAAAIGGAIVSDMIDFRARTLLCGLALVFAGAPMLMRTRRAEIVGEKPLSASIRALAPTQFGDASQFIVFALAARGGVPVLAFVAGLAAIMSAAALPMLTPQWPGKCPLELIRTIAGILLILAGLGIAASAFRVI